MVCLTRNKELALVLVSALVFASPVKIILIIMMMMMMMIIKFHLAPFLKNPTALYNLYSLK